MGQVEGEVVGDEEAQELSRPSAGGPSTGLFRAQGSGGGAVRRKVEAGPRVRSRLPTVVAGALRGSHWSCTRHSGT